MAQSQQLLQAKYGERLDTYTEEEYDSNAASVGQRPDKNDKEQQGSAEGSMQLIKSHHN
jgi:hypothetical protein